MASDKTQARRLIIAKECAERAARELYKQLQQNEIEWWPESTLENAIRKAIMRGIERSHKKKAAEINERQSCS